MLKPDKRMHGRMHKQMHTRMEVVYNFRPQPLLFMVCLYNLKPQHQ